MSLVFRAIVVLATLLVSISLTAQVRPEVEGYIHGDTAHISKLLSEARSLRHKATDSGISIYQQAFLKSRQMGYTDGMARALTGLGLFHMDKGEYNKSAAYYQLAEPLCQISTTRNGFLLANLYNSKAALYGNRGIFDSAVTYYYKALNLIERNQIKDTSLLLLIYSNLGGRLASNSQIDQAKFYLEKGIKIAIETKNKLMLGKFYKDMGILYGITKQQELSREYSFKALELFKQVNDPPSVVATYCNVGLSYMEQGRPEQALYYYKTALSDNIKTSPTQRVAAVRGVGSCYLALKDYKLAEQYYLRALAVSQKEKVNKSVFECYKALVAIYSGLGDYKKALSYKDAYQAMKDSTLNNDRINKVQQLEVEYRTAQKDKELVQKHLQLQHQENTIQKKNRLILFVVIGSALLIALLISLQQSFKNKKRLELVELEKDREITQLKAMMDGEEKERERIARELHDGIMVQFSAAQMHLSALIERTDLVRADKIEDVLVQLENATKELRKSTHNLMPDMLLEEGLAEATHYFCSNLEKSSGAKIHFQLIGSMVPVAPVYELMFYRIIQELLQNTMKHAKASEVLVQINCQPEMLSIAVEDNGTGFDPARISEHDGRGLSGIRSRIGSLHGQVLVNSRPGAGTSVYIEVETKYLQSLHVDARTY